MFKTLGGKILCLFLFVSLISMASAVVLRFMLLADFEEYRQGELMDRAQLVTAALEATYNETGNWSEDRVARDALRSLMLGLDITVYDDTGSLVISSARAFDNLPPVMKSRVEGAMKALRLGGQGDSMDFPLFSEGRRIGTVEITFLEREKDVTYMARADRFLALSLGLTALTVIAVSFGLTKAITSPLHQLTRATSDIGKGGHGQRVNISGKDEIAVLSRSFNLMSETLERQEQLRKKLLANVAHELRTPVAAMRAELEAMIDGVITPQPEALESLLQEMARLTSLVEGIEDITRAEAGSLTLSTESFSLHLFLQNMAERFQPLFSKSGVELGVDCREDEIITADPEKLERILVNLLDNAVRATEAGGRVTMKGAREKGRVVIAVVDSGRGMDDTVRRNVFERFFSTRPDGLGLGLSIVKELVEAHGGTIDVRSEVGRGTTFTITFPALHTVS